MRGTSSVHGNSRQEQCMCEIEGECDSYWLRISSNEPRGSSIILGVQFRTT